jgi:hypothetical protein
MSDCKQCHKLKSEKRENQGLLFRLFSKPKEESLMADYANLSHKCAVAQEVVNEVEELKAEQEVLFEMVNEPTFWSRRQDTLLQYYGNYSRRQASFMLVLMFVDPLIQNLWFVVLYKYLVSADCCGSLSLARALSTFTIVYSVATLVSAAVNAFNLIQCLTNRHNQLGTLSLIFVCCLLNLHMGLFGLVPSLHSHFRIQKLWTQIRAMAPLRLPQVYAMFTILGLLAAGLGADTPSGSHA